MPTVTKGPVEDPAKPRRVDVALVEDVGIAIEDAVADLKAVQAAGVEVPWSAVEASQAAERAVKDWKAALV